MWGVAYEGWHLSYSAVCKCAAVGGVRHYKSPVTYAVGWGQDFFLRCAEDGGQYSIGMIQQTKVLVPY